MNLYLIKRPDRADYDEYDSAVVCAATPEEAMHTHPGGEIYKTDFKACWIKAVDVKVTFLGVAHESIEAGIICASFNAG